MKHFCNLGISIFLQEEEEEEDKDAVGGRDLEDENDLLVPTEKPGLGPGTGQPTSRWHAVPLQHTLEMVPGSSIALRPRPGEPRARMAPCAAVAL